jgi:hypothetical protein
MITQLCTRSYGFGPAGQNHFVSTGNICVSVNGIAPKACLCHKAFRNIIIELSLALQMIQAKLKAERHRGYVRMVASPRNQLSYCTVSPCVSSVRLLFLTCAQLRAKFLRGHLDKTSHPVSLPACGRHLQPGGCNPSWFVSAYGHCARRAYLGSLPISHPREMTRSCVCMLRQHGLKTAWYCCRGLPHGLPTM